jgi:hypothetical protein
LQTDPTTVGLLFESAAFHDLTVYVGALDGEVRGFRDSNGFEIDSILSLPDGRWAAVEVKLGGSQVEPGVHSLASALRQIDTTQVGEPAFKLVLTATGPTYQTEDGTITCPLHRLRP